MSELAPIVLFVYNRLSHTQQTIEALQKNELASESELFIYSDAAKTAQDIEPVETVRSYINKIDGFKKITIIERDKNLGLAASIISGVTEIINQYGKVIVLEDDLVTSPYFLTFMNNALDSYKDEPKVMHVSGWNYPIDTQDLGDAFFWYTMNCWGWATWDDRWRYFKKDPDYLVKTWSKKKIKAFNLGGNYKFWRQVLDNKSGKISTWAVFWYASIFEQKGLCLNPSHSFVVNIGHDGSGDNCGGYDPFIAKIISKKIYHMPIVLEESKIATHRIKRFYWLLKVNIFSKLSRRIKIILSKNIKDH